jgi:glyceraldehyde 3-phosphate dehydrogenase
MKIAINGFGRIGRSVFRLLNAREGVEVVAINDLADSAALAYLLRHDTVMGPFQETAEIQGDYMVTPTQKVKMTEIPNPAELPWKEMGVDFVVEATGIFRTRKQIAMHLDAGARKVLLTVPAKACTTNCLAPLAYVLDKEFGIESGLMTTVHAYTNDQRLADVPHSDWRRSRAAAENTIPTTTGAARAVGKVMPQLAGKLDGMAMRVPVPNGSVVDLVTIMKRDVTVEEVREAVKAAAETDRLKATLRYATEALVSSDIVGDPHSSIFDSEYTSVIGGNMLKTLSWYDNEWGYSNRVVDLLERMYALG